MDDWKVFYSWQSDLPNQLNRGFIQDALERAAKVIRQDDSIKIEPVIDRDTEGIPGSPDIANTIFGKIDESQVFACDVSIINVEDKGKPTPNPNVLIELGYAYKALKSERILMVMNIAFGKPELLPFDLSKKRVITYHLPLGTEEKASVRKELVKKFENALRMIISSMTNVPSITKVSGQKTRLKEECEAILDGGNLREWKGLIDELWRDIPKRILEWKPTAEQVWDKGGEKRDSARFEAVEICLPSFIPIFVAVEGGREDLWKEAVGSLRQLVFLRNRMVGPPPGIVEIGSHMLYIAGSLGMAIATKTKQLHFVNSWMRLPMPMERFNEHGEKPWSEVKSAHRLWGKYLPCAPDQFKYLKHICMSDYLSGFFAEQKLLEKYLFMANLAQSLYELGLHIKDSKSLEKLKAGETDPLNLKVLPLWTLMKPDDFNEATWELFDTSARVFEFVSPASDISSYDFWTLWRIWKHICAKPMISNAYRKELSPPRSEYLMLPGVPHVWK